MTAPSAASRLADELERVERFQNLLRNGRAEDINADDIEWLCDRLVAANTNSVPLAVYESAVKGRQDMREALRTARASPQPGAEAVAWLIGYNDGQIDRKIAFTHNCVQDFRDMYGEAASAPLYANPPQQAGWVAVPDDLLSHIGDWRKACEIAELNTVEPDASYWKHQLDTLDGIEAMLAAAPKQGA